MLQPRGNRRNQCAPAVGLVIIVALLVASASSPASAAVQKFWTTFNDFDSALFSGMDSHTVTTDLDGDPRNGLANPFAPGQLGTPGALSVTLPPDSTTAPSLESGELSGNAAVVAAFHANGEMQIDYTLPTGPTAGTFFNPFFFVTSDGAFFQQSPASSVVNNGTYLTATFSYNPQVATSQILRMGFLFTNDKFSDTFVLDNIRVLPEPAPMVAAAMALGALALMRRVRFDSDRVPVRIPRQ